MTEDEKKQLQKKAEKFLKENDDGDLSAAMFQYASFAADGKLSILADMIASKINPGIMNDAEIERQLEAVHSIEDIDRWMRTPNIPRNTKKILYEKMLADEDETAELIKKRILRSFRDVFIENAQYFMMKSKTNYSPWIMENLSRMKSPYARCSMALVAGFRGGIDDIEPLMKEAEYLKANYKGESFWEGPAYAVTELYHHYFDTDKKPKKKAGRKK